MQRQAVCRQLIRIALITSLVLGGLSTAAGKGNTPPPPLAETSTQIQVFGVWHCGNHYCDWQEDIDLIAFDKANRWLLERGGSGADSTRPAVNVVVLSFVHPLKLLQQTDSGELGMIPKGMSQPVVNYFKDAGIRVMLSIGGITYTDAWDAALAMDPKTLGTHAATIAQTLGGVGVEIDYENSSSPNIEALGRFIAAYRQQLPYDASGSNHAARLTIDVVAGDRWLIALNRHATQYWLRPESPVLDYANAMVGGTSSGTPSARRGYVPTTDCTGGMGVAAGTFNVPIPMPALRQK